MQDMIIINQRNQKQTILLISGLFFLMIGALAALFIVAIQSSTNSIEYMLYRYIVTGQYSSATINYGRLTAPAILLIAIGVILSMAYVIEKWKEKENPYGATVAELGDEDAYAFLDMDYKNYVMVTSDGLYDAGIERQAAIYCTVYYYGKEAESNEEEYEKMAEEYGGSQVIHFSYGADGCINEIIEY